MAAPDEEEQKAASVTLGATEDEPDDNFSIELGKATGKKASAKPAAEEKVAEEAPAKDEAEQEAAPASPLPIPMLLGSWQQLEGTARPSGIGPRLLAWNASGHIASYSEQLRLEVRREGDEKSQRIPDYDGMQMASISRGASVLAADANSAGGPMLLIRPAERWEKAVFSAPLSGSDEVPEAVTCGDDFIAALTSSRLLRLYTFSGMPIGLLSMPGRSVALASRGSLLLVVTGNPLLVNDSDCDDALEFRLLDVRSRVERASGRLPLSPGARLRWIGFGEDLVPVAIDTSGNVRALLGSGAGCWGPAGGACGEWVPVLSIADLEADLGPLWAVTAEKGSIVFAEVGLDGEEPRPRPAEAADAVEGEVEGDQTDKPAFFGVGSNCKLRTIPWKLPLGPFTVAGDLIETAFREQLQARHAKDFVAMDILQGDAAQGAEAMEKKSKSSALKLFAQLATQQEVERALHVAQFSLANVSGSFKLLDMAHKLAEKGHHYKLADAVAALDRNSAPKAVSKQAESSVPMASRKELPPLFKPGELDEENDEVTQKSSSEDLNKPSATPPANLSATLSATPSAARSAVTPAAVASVPAAAPAAASIAATADSARGVSNEPVSRTPPAASPVSATSTTSSSNPFARKRPLSSNKTKATPHLLRDALKAGGQPPSKAARM